MMKNTKGVYKFHFQSGRRTSNLYGVFVAEVRAIDKLIAMGVDICFGEVSGKHSEVYGPIESPEDITLVTTEANVVSAIEENDLSSGFNPLDYRFLNGESVVSDLGITDDCEIDYEDVPSGEILAKYFEIQDKKSEL